MLRTLGASPRQLLALVGLESTVGLGMGLLAGTLIGYGVALMMRPLLSRTLATAMGGDAIHHITIAWPALIQLYGSLYHRLRPRASPPTMDRLRFDYDAGLKDEYRIIRDWRLETRKKWQLPTAYFY